ncbi:hypothetical protein GXB85_08695 [Cellulomonas sp. APG4]|uniref:hypothetical protein n=1 Tax=Cellulomonas sp. APG4 TaxID=1538656 RepID=UPI00137B3B14|nr:hypothetical protein [Cellulomonas sp. APG4]NCT91023.1 hypothetical protein [Cellulomonas sp. APG4]
MSEIQMELEVIEQMAGRHRMAAEDLEEALTSVPTSVDGGVASDVIASIVAKLAPRADDLATASRVAGAVLDEIVADTRRTDESAAEAFRSALDTMGDE